MYTFTEYFDKEKISKGYEGGKEHLGDLLLLLDMALECFLRDKGKRCREKTWHSRGTMVSEEEIQDYFDLPPFLRPDDRVSHEAMEDAGKARDYIRKREALTKEAFLPMAKVREELSLSFSEELTLLLAVSIRLDLKYLRIYRFIQDDYTLKFPTRGTALALLSYLGLPSEGLFSPDGTLMRFLLDRREDERMRPTPPLLEPLLLSDTAASYLLGEEDETSLPLLEQKEPEGYEGFFQRALEGLLKDRPHPGKASFRYIESADPEDVSFALLSLAKKRKEPYYEIDVRRLKGGENFLHALTFFLRMHEGVLLLKEEKPEEPEEGVFLPEYTLLDLLPVFLKALPGRMIYLCGEKKLPPLSVPVEATPAVLSLPLPEVKERIRIWQYFLAAEGILLEDNIDILDVADCHELSFSSIRRILRQARETMDSRGEETLPRSLLQELLFRLNTSHFDNLASAVEVRYTWEDIFLGSAEKKRLKAACDRFRLRNRVGAEWGITRKNAYGNAVIILMYGPPGTGKTMAAQAIANEVMTPLYRVDVSQIFSKYIGETQKNLSRIFDEAEKRSVVLFFDEADALFTKRTEIRDSHDKYANSDTSFLLQKVEEYSGITILATNSYQSFDSAFMRRLTYVVHFERPDEATREKMWRTMLPEEVPMDPEIDYAFLAARFTELTGSNIKSILLTAAYFAGAEGRPVSMRDVILATRYEFEKLGRLIDSEEFGKYAMYMQEG